MTTSTNYNGWTSYREWNVALYIKNDYSMYTVARDWVAERREYDESVDYDVFRHTLTELFGEVTPDGVSYSDPTLNTQELSEMLQEM